MLAYPVLFLDDNDLSHDFLRALIEVEKLPILPQFEVCRRMPLIIFRTYLMKNFLGRLSPTSTCHA